MVKHWTIWQRTCTQLEKWTDVFVSHKWRVHCTYMPLLLYFSILSDLHSDMQLRELHGEHKYERLSSASVSCRKSSWESLWVSNSHRQMLKCFPRQVSNFNRIHYWMTECDWRSFESIAWFLGKWVPWVALCLGCPYSYQSRRTLLGWEEQSARPLGHDMAQGMGVEGLRPR